ncbi:MAG TPA: HEPN domain-containing protein [Clostridiales bacterium]|nr:HEPN domain-containing protein [Clostridiales bacterium]
MNINSYYLLAKNDYRFLKYVEDTDLYNNIATQSQQTVEKYLKHIVYEFCVENPEAINVLKTHNLTKLYRIIMESGIDLEIERGDLSLLKDYYFNSRYPGDNFIAVSQQEARECIDLVELVKEKIEKFLMSRGYCEECGNKLFKLKTCKNHSCINFNKR